jgi:hypothetical protein
VSPPPPPLLAALVVKHGVLIGSLPQAQRELALGMAAKAIAADTVHTEPQVNAALGRCLAGECAFLDTDHVDLRRWLIDTGWWRRDGFGRAYQRVPEGELTPLQQPVHAALEALDLPAWAAAERARLRAARAAHRTAWKARTGGG